MAVTTSNYLCLLLLSLLICDFSFTHNHKQYSDKIYFNPYYNDLNNSAVIFEKKYNFSLLT